MAKIITFSRYFPAYHSKKGQPTYFVEKFLKGRPNTIESEAWNPEKSLIEQLPMALDMWAEFKPKYHTIRAGKRWNEGDYFSPRVWSDKPYKSKMITIAPDTEIIKIWSFKIREGLFFINNHRLLLENDYILYDIAHNDGLTRAELFEWFKYPNYFDGQIICWNKSVEY